MKIGIELKWAFIFFAMGLLWMLGEKLVGLHDVYIELHPIYTNFIAIPAIAIYAFAFHDKRKNILNGTMSYKEGLICGFIITGIVTILSPLSQYISSTLITPEYFVNVINYSVTHELMTQEQAKAYFNLKNYIIQSIIFAPVMGILTTLIVAAFTKKQSAVY
jgi:hypothetical protein